MSPLPAPAPLPAAGLSTAVHDNLYALFHAMAAHLPGAELVEEAGGSCHHAFPPNPMFKAAWRTRVPAAEIDDAIERRLAWFRERRAPFAFWWLDPSDPAGLPERLAAHGLTPHTLDAPGMVAHLDAFDEDARCPDGCTIVPATERQALEDWRDVFCAAYEVPGWAGQAWIDATRAIGPDRAPWQLYVGYWQGRPVATNILFGGGGVASVYGVGTLPEARGRGIGTAVTRVPLVAARAQGYRHAVLFATDDGYPVYRRMGFRDLDCKVGRYLWLDR